MIFIGDDNKLWGLVGGELEYVSQRIVTRQRPTGEFYNAMIIRFTDHDVQAMPEEELIDGKYYELEFPIAQE